MNRKTLVYAGALLLAALVRTGAAQTFDNSGNGLLSGTYYMRQVAWLIADNSGSLSEAISIYGGITFDGKGNYTINGQACDSNSCTGGSSVQPYQATGTYSISASGYGYITDVLIQGDKIFGSVANGIFTGSSTETANGYNDLFIAAPLASPAPTNSFFQGTYSLVDLDLSSGTPGGTIEASFQVNADGNGGLGNVTVNGYVASNGSQLITQSISRVQYFFSGGAANVNFRGGSSSLVAGTKYLYFSPDGSFVFGGSPTGWDMIAGVKTGGNTPPSFNGLYYQAGAYQDESQLASSGSGNLNSEYGALNVSSGLILGHQRVLSVFNSNPVDYTYSDTVTANQDGTDDDPNNHYIFGSGGAVGVALSKPPLFGIKALVRAPAFSGQGVYINPTGVVNNATFAPFTAGVAPGEMISIYGTGLAAGTQTDSTFPTTLAGVQVSINNLPAPIYYVSPTRIIAVVPFGVTQTVAAIQVTNNGTASNVVTEYTGLTQPGVFPEVIGGVIYGAALHADYSQVTPANPAKPGETLQIYLAGLGDVNPAVPDGTPGPNPPATTTNALTAYLGGVQAPVSFSGLAPGGIGYYQMNIQVPSGVSAGNVYLDIS
ncbi:MAG TPA: hypothetical protein VJ732_09350, partial [Bryobacteraceae bacterium]|nr:hypothetical protein [Bryobacteraceae bacterium]